MRLLSCQASATAYLHPLVLPPSVSTPATSSLSRTPRPKSGESRLEEGGDRSKYSIVLKRACFTRIAIQRRFVGTGERVGRLVSRPTASQPLDCDRKRGQRKKEVCDRSNRASNTSRRESSGERSSGSGSNSTESYKDGKEEEYQESKGVEHRTLKIEYGETLKKPRRVLSLLDRWREIQKTLAGSPAPSARRRPMGRKGRKAVEDGGKGDGLADGDEEVHNIREKMIKDMQEEIRLEQYNQAQSMRLEAQQLEKYETQLTKTRAVLDGHWSAYAENGLLLRLQENWDRYMACDGLPDPGSLPDLNTFLFVWTMENEDVDMATVTGICDVITDLLAKLRRIVQFTDDCSGENGDEFESIARELRGKLQGWIDLACYRLLRNIEANMTREDMRTSRYMRESNQMVCCVWAPIALPVGAKRFTDKERKPVEVTFNEIKLTIKLPADVDCHRMAIRGLWLAYDHYSVETNSRRMPDLPEELRDPWYKAPDLLEFARREYREKLRIWEEQAEERQLRLEEKKTILQKMESPPALSSARRKGKRGKKQKRPKSAKNNASEFEETLETFLPEDGELLPYLPTPNEIVRQREGDSCQRGNAYL